MLTAKKECSLVLLSGLLKWHMWASLVHLKENENWCYVPYLVHLKQNENDKVPSVFCISVGTSSLPFMLSCSCYCQIMLAIKIKCFNKMLYILSVVEKRNWVGVFYYSVNEMEMLLVHLK